MGCANPGRVLIKRGQYPTLSSVTEFTQAPSQFQRQRREKAPLVAEALTSNAEGGRGDIQASSIKLQVQAGGAQSWWGGLCGEVTWQLDHHGSLEIEVNHRDLSPNAAPASGR